MQGFEWLSMGYGFLGFALCSALWSMAKRFRIPAQKEHYQDRVVQLLKIKIDLQAQQAGIDEELAEMWEKSPEPSFRWVFRSIEEARLLPPRLLDLAYRYGFAVPNPSVVWEEYGGVKASSLTKEQKHEPVPVAAADNSRLTRMNAWGETLDS